MEIKKFSKENLRNIANNVSNATKNTITNIGETAKNAAATVAENVKEGSKQFSQQLDQKRYEKDRKILCPIFKEELLESNFVRPYLINIVGYDKRRENKACEGAIGFYSGKDIKILNIYKEFADLLGVSFYPLLEETIYHVDPCFNDLYIKLNDYFAYLKKVRVDELTNIAQTLGAKHVEIILKSNDKKSQSRNASYGFNGSRGITAKIGIEGLSASSKSEFSGVEVAAKIDFAGNETPAEPKLVYFKNEGDINTLIKMRLNPNNENKILSKTYSLQYGNSSGIKISNAQKIDAALSEIKINAGRSITNEVISENNTTLEYSIVF